MMNMKKRMMAVLLTAIMAAALTGCGGGVFLGLFNFRLQHG